MKLHWAPVTSAALIVGTVIVCATLLVPLAIETTREADRLEQIYLEREPPASPPPIVESADSHEGLAWWETTLLMLAACVIVGVLSYRFLGDRS